MMGVMWRLALTLPLVLAGCGGADEPDLLEAQTEPAIRSRDYNPSQGPDLLGSVLELRTVRLDSARKAGVPVTLLARYEELREPSRTCYGTLCFPSDRLVPRSRIIGTSFATEDGRAAVDVVDLLAIDDADLAGNVYAFDVRERGADGVLRRVGPLCAGPSNQAIVVRGYFTPGTLTWNDDASYVTFACRGSAVFKVTSWGYSPSRSAPHFSAAVRAARADYCGNGASFTRAGTVIEVFDRSGIRPLDARHVVGGPFRFEAGWGPDRRIGASEFPSPGGAACLSKLRWNDLRFAPAPTPGTSSCPRLPHGGEFEQICDAENETGEPTAADYAEMERLGALVFTYSRPR